MHSLRVARLVFALPVLFIAATISVAQVPLPYSDQQLFWENPEFMKTLKLTEKQRAELNQILNKTNQQFRKDLQAKFTPGQWKRIESLRATRSQAAARMGVYGPEAQQTMKALDRNRATTENFSILVSTLLTQAVANSAQFLQMRRGQTSDPCRDALDAFTQSSPQLDTTQVKLSLDFDGKKHTGNSCPDGTADLAQNQNRPTTIKATYPCAVTTQGVNLAPGCEFAAQITVYQY